MGKILKVIVEVVAGLAVLGAAVWVFQTRKGTTTQTTRAAMTNEVAVATAEARLTSDRLEALGTGRARESVLITASESERVTGLFFEDGEVVEAGRLLAKLEDRLLLAERSIAVAVLEEERREMARARELLEKEGIARRLADARETSLAKAELALEAIDARLELREVRAPFAGVLGLRRVSAGAWVTPGTVIATLDDVSEIHIDFSVPERYLGAVGTGVVFTARTQMLPDAVVTGRVTHVEARIDTTSLSATARGTVGNGDGRLRPGMLFAVWLEASPRMSVWVPEKAMVSLGEKQFVFVANGNRVTRREVFLGRREAGMVEVREGLGAGEQVVTDGVGKMRDGMTVRVATSNNEQVTSNNESDGGTE